MEFDGNRLQEFRQAKKEVRGSDRYLIVGIDVAKERHNAFFGTATGKTLHKGLVFDNTIEGFRKLLRMTEALKVQYDLSKVIFGVEPTANYYECPDPKVQDLRNLLSLKRRLKKEEHGLRVRIRNQLLAQYFPEMDQYFGTSSSLAVIRCCLDPSAIAGMEFDVFCRNVAPGKLSMAQQKRLQMIWRKAPESIGCSMGDATPFEAQVIVSKLHQVRETIKAVDEKIKDICMQFPEYACLLSISGFGPDVSSKVLAAMGYPYRFTSGKQVLKMSGFDLRANRSGKSSNNATPVISKTRKGLSSLCPLPGIPGRLLQQQGLHDILHKQAERPSERKGHRHQDASEAGGETFDYRMDFNEEKRTV